MARQPSKIAYPPCLMRSETAAAYVDEVSVESFLRRIGTVYPEPIKVPGRGYVWLREDLERAMQQNSRTTRQVQDANDVL